MVAAGAEATGFGNTAGVATVETGAMTGLGTGSVFVVAAWGLSFFVSGAVTGLGVGASDFSFSSLNPVTSRICLRSASLADTYSAAAFAFAALLPSSSSFGNTRGAGLGARVTGVAAGVAVIETGAAITGLGVGGITAFSPFFVSAPNIPPTPEPVADPPK